ncbi:helix-turn-helix transcriptional regulator [Sphingomonas bacterium]|uniref:helix-turn-helix domain-containing protein n=1 Tax=Sphingomonas bacterium TaxID=1895847 RepID=UPI0015767179|nr:helix-turn-helix transcriptional regulator [Sphingomonas bacterium]
MSDLSALTERERRVLVMLGRGHDAKSMAVELDLSVHTVNERLRTARRKLGASSSREAARMLDALESCESAWSGPKFSGPQKLGVTGQVDLQAERGARTDPRTPLRRAFLYTTGAMLMIFVTISAIAFWMAVPTEGPAVGSQAAPHVIRTLPAAGATIAPGPFLLSVTYDRPMRGGSYSFVQSSADSYPACSNRPTQSADGRTFMMRCTAAPGRTYHVAFNETPYMNFKSVDGVPATPFHLTFTAGSY